MLAIACGPAWAQGQQAGQAETAVETVLWYSGVERPLAAAELLYEGQRIETEPDGRAGLWFQGDARVQVSPSSSLEILEFVYDEDLGPLRLRLKLSGTHHLVGGKLSEGRRQLFAETDLAQLRMIGAVVLVMSQGEADDTFACLLFGKALEGRHRKGDATAIVRGNEQCLRFTPDGGIEKFRLSARRSFIYAALRTLEGTRAEPTLLGRNLPGVYSWNAAVRNFDEQNLTLDATRAEDDNLLIDQRVIAVDSAIEAGLIPSATAAPPQSAPSLPSDFVTVPCCGPAPLITVP
jgi:hypothetical protein